MKIANKISISFFAVALLLASSSAFIFYTVAKNDLKKSIFNNLSTAAVSRANHIETYLRMLQVSVGQLSKSVILENLLKTNGKEDPRWAEAFAQAMMRLTRTKEANSSISEFLLMDIKGKVVASSNESDIGVDKSTDDFFLGAQKGAYIKDAYFSETQKTPLMAVSTPMIESQTGEFLGVLVARVKLDELNAIVVERTGLGETGEIYIVNKYGFMVTPSRFSVDASLNRRVDTENMRRLKLHKGKEHPLPKKKMEHVFSNYLGTQVLGTHEYIPQMKWGVLAEISTKEAFAPLAKLRLIFLMILFIVPLAAWLLGIHIAKFITGPLHTLHKGTEIIGSGNINYKVGTDAKDEVGQLSRAFDEMVENLKKNTTSIEKLNKEITERKKIEEAQKRLVAVIEATSDFVGFADAKDKHIIYMNKAGRMMVGFDEGEDVTKLKIFDVHPEWVNKMFAEEILPAAVRDGTWTGESAFLNIRDRHEIPVLMVLSSHKAPNGEVEVFSTISHDITERKQAEENINRQASELDTNLKEALKSRAIMTSMLDDNNQIREELEKSLEKLRETQAQIVHAEKMEAVGRMASGVAHEVKNPLGIILQGINYFEGEIPPEQKDNRTMLDMMKDSIKRADHIVRALLDFSRTSEINMQPEDINIALGRAMNLAQHVFNFKNIEIVFELTPNLPKVLLDTIKIDQVFVNLFSNASDAMPNGGKLFIRSRLAALGAWITNTDGVPTRRGESKDTMVIIEIEDTGIGMDEEAKKKIFEPFFTTKKLTEGTGLGLSVAKSIVEMHNGIIHVESQKNKGTKVSIAFKPKGGL